MNWNNNKDLSRNHRKVYARVKGIKNEPDTLKKRNKNLSGRKNSSWDISQGFRLKIQSKWIIAFVVILFGCIFLFLKRPGNSQRFCSSDEQGTATKPEIKHVRIRPAKPNSNNNLLADVRIKGNSRDKISFRYQWYKNGKQIELERGKRLSYNHFKKGDIIKATVIPIMSGVEGEPVTSSGVHIKNSPPVLKSVVIQPKVVYSNTDLMVEAVAEDADEELVSFRYQWIKNGSGIYGEESKYIKHSHFVKDDRIQVQVTPFDGYGHGTPMISSIVIVNNSPPNIISHPPSTFEENGTFVYRVVAEDLDNDLLTFSLSSKNPPGVSIDSKSGMLVWKIPNDLEPGPSMLEVIVSDQDGSEASQWFTLNIQFVVTHEHG